MSDFSVRTDIIEPVIAWIHLILGKNFKVIVDKPNKARPSDPRKRFDIRRPYITLNFPSSLAKMGSSNIFNTTVDSDNKFCMGESNQFTLGIKAYSDPGEDNRNTFEPFELLRRLRSSLDDEVRRRPLDDAGLSARIVNDILDISTAIESGFESRAQLDIVMGIMINETVDLGIIEKTEVTGTYNGITEPKQTIP